MFWEGFFFWVANASAIVGLITAGWAGYSGYRFWRARRKMRERLRAFSLQSTGRSVAIAVGLGPRIGNIEKAVRTYLMSKGLEMEIVPISDPERVTEEKASEIADRLLEVRRILNERENSPTQIHLFYGGPNFVDPALGAALANWVPVVVYHYEGGTYHPMARFNKLLSGVPTDPIDG